MFLLMLVNSFRWAPWEGDAADHVLALLEEMDKSSVTPDLRSYSTALNVCAKADDAKAAEALLSNLKMEGRYTVEAWS